MKFTLDYPISTQSYDMRLVSHEVMADTIRAIEAVGFSAVSFSEHPAPSLRWLQSGGHDTLDPLAALSFCAAITSRIRLMPYLLVLPYHNPFALAKTLTTVDRLSAGRLTIVAGTGYLRSEFFALGIDMEERNERFDEAVEVMRGLWRQPSLDHEGRRFHGRNVAQRPMPLTPGGPAIWAGGNSAAARRRAAQLGGWSPLIADDSLATTVRTSRLESLSQLARQIRHVRDLATELRGSDAEVMVQVHTKESGFIGSGGSIEKHRDHLGDLADIGVNQFVLQPSAPSASVLVEGLAQYGAEFIESADEVVTQ